MKSNKWSKYNKEVKKYSVVKKINPWLVKKIMDEQRTDAIANASGSNANFRCENCKKYYNISYGVLGKPVTVVFGDDSYYCRDCVHGFGKGRFVKA